MHNFKWTHDKIVFSFSFYVTASFTYALSDCSFIKEITPKETFNVKQTIKKGLKAPGCLISFTCGSWNIYLWLFVNNSYNAEFCFQRINVKGCEEIFPYYLYVPTSRGLLCLVSWRTGTSFPVIRINEKQSCDNWVTTEEALQKH